MTDTVTRLAAALADRYRIERELGQGGMATVYLARDLKHDRDVAIKVLHPDLGAALGGERFLSEIRTTARLQHPHILPLLDSGDADGLLYYVMPLVTGETLRARLARERQLPIADAVRIAREVASALDYAHRQGVIHRDIKPENILLHDGSALVADFGIALAVQTAGGARMTQTGLSLGTPQYMSPEQAMGERTIDARSDVYALGAVLYEMFAGDAPFIGSSVQAIVAKVLSEKPTPIHTLRDTVPLAIEQAVSTALAKLPADRFASAAEFATALGNNSGATYSARVTAARPLARDARTWVAVGAGAVALALAGVLLARPHPSAPSVSRQQVHLWNHTLEPALSPGSRAVATQAAIASDGSSIVFVDSTPSGYTLMRKRRDARDATVMTGTDGALSPAFSPDGRWIAYATTEGKLKKVPVEGGGSITIAVDVHDTYRILTWLDDQTLVYLSSKQTLNRVPVDGGIATPLKGWNAASFTATLWGLPKHRGILVTRCVANCSLSSDVYVYDLRSDSLRLLVSHAAGASYAPTGHLVYTSRDGGLFAAAFDLNTLMLRGGAVSVVDDVEPMRFAMSPSGAMLYTSEDPSAAVSDLMWVARDGQSTLLDSLWRGQFEYPTLSPDGRSLAVSVRDKATDLWIREANGNRHKVFSDGLVNWRASWMPDGKSLTFVAVGEVDKNLADVTVRRAAAEGSEKAQLLQRHTFGLWESEVSRDGQWLVMRADEAGANTYAIRARRLTGDTTLRAVIVPEARATVLNIALSPDGRWLAYTSNESGPVELYVTSFPDARAKSVVSRGGGTEPRWSRDGRELFFVSGGRLHVVAVPPGPTFNPGNPQVLFSLAGYRRARNRPQYDVSPDGRRFVMIRDRANAGGRGVVYVENWFSELLAKVKK
ncbi:MAG: LpqB family beta-propeller domain-containing protein [Gemmatimonas sp.]